MQRALRRTRSPLDRFEAAWAYLAERDAEAARAGYPGAAGGGDAGALVHVRAVDAFDLALPPTHRLAAYFGTVRGSLLLFFVVVISLVLSNVGVEGLLNLLDHILFAVGLGA